MSIIYQKAGAIIKDILKPPKKKNAQIKTFIFGDEEQVDRNAPQITLLVQETLRWKPIIEYILKSSGVLKEFPILQDGMPVLAMLYDFLISERKKIFGSGKLKKAIFACKNALNATITRIKIRCKIQNLAEILPPNIRDDKYGSKAIMRYARVNKIKTNAERVLQHLVEDGYNEISIEAIFGMKNRKAKVFAIDKDIGDGNLLVFPSGTDLHSHILVESGHLVLQSKSSAISGYLLNPPPNSIVIDGMAAPGMKTSQLAESMENTGRIFAVDHIKTRLLTLQQITNNNGITNITAIHKNFLHLNPNDSRFSEVTHILCDPSCSGSGLVDRKDTLILWAKSQIDVEGLIKASPNPPLFEPQLNPETLQKRLHALSLFQYTAILHAFQFPKVQRVVYSTCSIHQEENENVVQKVLEVANGAFELVHILPDWPRRGNKSDFPEAEKCVRTTDEDRTIGFFVACFQRTSDEPFTYQPTDEQLDLWGTKIVNKRKKAEKKKAEEIERALNPVVFPPPPPPPPKPLKYSVKRKIAKKAAEVNLALKYTERVLGLPPNSLPVPEEHITLVARSKKNKKQHLKIQSSEGTSFQVSLDSTDESDSNESINFESMTLDSSQLSDVDKNEKKRKRKSSNIESESESESESEEEESTPNTSKKQKRKSSNIESETSPNPSKKQKLRESTQSAPNSTQNTPTSTPNSNKRKRTDLSQSQPIQPNQPLLTPEEVQRLMATIPKQGKPKKKKVKKDPTKTKKALKKALKKAKKQGFSTPPPKPKKNKEKYNKNKGKPKKTKSQKRNAKQRRKRNKLREM